MENHAVQHLPPIEKMGARVRRLRKRLDLTQAQLGEKVGVKELAVGEWERENSSPKGENLVKLADALGVTPHYIVYGEAGVYREAVEEIGAIVDRLRLAADLDDLRDPPPPGGAGGHDDGEGEVA